MLQELVLSGIGGQGALLIGQVLAVASTFEDKNATWMPTYGPEKRGGSAYCDVIVSDQRIGSPIVDEPQTVVAMDPRSFAQFESLIVPQGTMIYNTSMCDGVPSRTDIRYVPVNAGDITHQLGTAAVTNMVLLGALLAVHPMVNDQSITLALQEKLGAKKAHLVDINLQAIAKGKACVTPQA